MAAVVVLLTLGGAGCGSSNELRSAKQAPAFVDDLLEGNASKWDGLADDADQVAIGLWLDRTLIQSLGNKLKKVGSEWGCDVADVAAQARQSFDEGVLEISPEARARIVNEYSTLATEEEINEVIDETWAVDYFAVADVIDAVCSFDG